MSQHWRAAGNVPSMTTEDGTPDFPETIYSGPLKPKTALTEQESRSGDSHQDEIDTIEEINSWEY